MPDANETTCPFCGVEFELGAAACPACDLPLVVPDGTPARSPFDGADLFENLERDETMRRRPRVGMLAIEHEQPMPEYARGDLRCVVVALNQAEADMLEDMLRSEGIPCLIRAVDNIGPAAMPQILGAGRREVLVPATALSDARDLLRIEAPINEPVVNTPFAMSMAVVAGIALAVLCVSLILAFA
jgi:hypothetical protein